MNSKKLKLITASAYTATLNVIFVMTLTIWAEFSVPLKDWLKSVSGHHWTTKSIFSILLFILFTIIFFLALSNREDKVRTVLRNLAVTTIMGVVVLTLFFSGHHFKWF